MAVTLRSMLAMLPLREAAPEVLSAAEDLDRPVRWVHVVEVEDPSSLLDGHEVVLTTGIPLSGADAVALSFIRQLGESRCCGLVVELGSTLAEVPAHLVAEAERVRLPIVVLRRSVRFVSVTEAVHRVIVGEQYRGLEFAKRTHEVFTTLTVDSADALSIVTQAAELAGAPVVLEDLRHRVVAVGAHGATARELLGRWEERSRGVPALGEVGVSGEESWLTCPVGLRGAPWGRLVVPVPGEDVERDSMVLQRAAEALQISRLVERDRRDLHTQAQESFLMALSDGRIKDEQEAVARARALGLRGSRRYTPAIVLFTPTPAKDEVQRQRLTRSQTRAVGQVLDQTRHHAIVGALQANTVGLLLAVANAEEEDRAFIQIAAALAESDGARAGGGPVLAVGQHACTLLAAAAHLRPVVHIADAGRSLRSPLPYFRSVDVRLRGLLAQLRDDERLQAFAESELAPVMGMAPAERDAALDVLRTYVKHRGNKASAAEEIGISRQNLYTRLRRLESRLGVALDDADTFLSLGVALLTLDTLGQHAGPA